MAQQTRKVTWTFRADIEADRLWECLGTFATVKQAKDAVRDRRVAGLCTWGVYPITAWKITPRLAKQATKQETKRWLRWLKQGQT